jgi:hypothetical protein
MSPRMSQGLLDAIVGAYCHLTHRSGVPPPFLLVSLDASSRAAFLARLFWHQARLAAAVSAYLPWRPRGRFRHRSPHWM